MLTEEEAKGKWCPFARSADCGANNAVAANRAAGEGALCIASECMAWRWTVQTSWKAIYDALKAGRTVDAVREYRALFGTPLKDSLDAVRAIDLNQPMPRDIRAGFCGLAGKP